MKKITKTRAKLRDSEKIIGVGVSSKLLNQKRIRAISKTSKKRKNG